MIMVVTVIVERIFTLLAVMVTGVTMKLVKVIIMAAVVTMTALRG